MGAKAYRTPRARLARRIRFAFSTIELFGAGGSPRIASKAYVDADAFASAWAGSTSGGMSIGGVGVRLIFEKGADGEDLYVFDSVNIIKKSKRRLRVDYAHAILPAR